MYKAVEGITGDYRLYQWNAHGPAGASPQAAAAAAGHELLITYFPASQARLDAALAASLATVPDGAAEDLGVAYGIAAADHIVALRAHDGRNSAQIDTGSERRHRRRSRSTWPGPVRLDR